jgi:hypothetical protein
MKTSDAASAAYGLPRTAPSRLSNFAPSAERVSIAGAEHAGVSAKPAGEGAAVRMTCMDRAIINIHFRGFHRVSSSVRTENHRLLRRLCGQWLPGWRLPAKLRAEPLPAELERKLSVLNPGYSRVQVNCDVLLIEATTRRVVDVLQNVDAT